MLENVSNAISNTMLEIGQDLDSYPQNTRHLPIFLWSVPSLYDKQLHIAARPFYLYSVALRDMRIMHFFTGMLCIYHCKCMPYRNSFLSKEAEVLEKKF